MKWACILLMLLGAAGTSIGLARMRGEIRASEYALLESAHLAVEVGLDPATLAVAGFDAESAERLLDRLAAARRLRTEFADAKASSDEAAAATTAARERLASDPGNAEWRSGYAAACDAAQAAAARLESIRSELIDAAVAGAAPPQIAALHVCRGSRNFALHPSMQAVPHSPAGGIALEECLIAESRAHRRDERIDPSVAERLAEIRAVLDVVVANERLITHRPAIEAAFAGN